MNFTDLGLLVHTLQFGKFAHLWIWEKSTSEEREKEKERETLNSNISDKQKNQS